MQNSAVSEDTVRNCAELLNAHGEQILSHKSVAIVGESGTGKTYLLRQMRELSSKRQEWLKEFELGRLHPLHESQLQTSAVAARILELDAHFADQFTKLELHQLPTLLLGLKSAFLLNGACHCPTCSKISLGSGKLLEISAQNLIENARPFSNEILIVRTPKGAKHSHRQLMKLGISQVLVEERLRNLGDLDSLSGEIGIVDQVIPLGQTSHNILDQALSTPPTKDPIELWGHNTDTNSVRKLCSIGKELFCSHCGKSYDFETFAAEGLHLSLGRLRYEDIRNLSIASLAKHLSNHCKNHDRHLLELAIFLDLAAKLGIPHITLNRHIGSLSTGESFLLSIALQLHLAASGTQYILDGPSRFLSDNDLHTALSTLNQFTSLKNIPSRPSQLRDNSVLVADTRVPHRQHFEMILPIANESRPSELGPKKPTPQHGRISLECVVANGKKLALDIPIRQIAAITGAMGSGKSCILRDELYAGLVALRKRVPLPNNIQTIRSDESFGRVAFLPRSYKYDRKKSRISKFMELDLSLAEHLSKLEESRLKGITAKDFAQSKRSRQTARIKYKGLLYNEFLDLSIGELLQLLGHLPNIGETLRFASLLGLADLRASQDISCLSSGEYQRLQLAIALQTKLPSTLFLIERPVSGLGERDSLAFIQLVREELLPRGHSVIVEETEPCFIKNADCTITI